jgi:putative transposase
MTRRRRKRHAPEQIVRKLRDAEAMFNAGQDEAAVLQALEISESTYLRWRKQYGGMKAEELARPTYIDGLTEFVRSARVDC